MRFFCATLSSSAANTALCSSSSSSLSSSRPKSNRAVVGRGSRAVARGVGVASKRQRRRRRRRNDRVADDNDRGLAIAATNREEASSSYSSSSSLFCACALAFSLAIAPHDAAAALANDIGAPSTEATATVPLRAVDDRAVSEREYDDDTTAKRELGQDFWTDLEIFIEREPPVAVGFFFVLCINGMWGLTYALFIRETEEGPGGEFGRWLAAVRLQMVRVIFKIFGSALGRFTNE